MNSVNNAYEKVKKRLDELVKEDARLDMEISGQEKTFDDEKMHFIEKEKEKRELISNVNQLLQRKKEMIEELQIKSVEVPYADSESENSPEELFEKFEDLLKKYFSTANSQIHIDYTLLIKKNKKKPAAAEAEAVEEEKAGEETS